MNATIAKPPMITSANSLRLLRGRMKYPTSLAINSVSISLVFIDLCSTFWMIRWWGEWTGLYLPIPALLRGVPPSTNHP